MHRKPNRLREIVCVERSAAMPAAVDIMLKGAASLWRFDTVECHIVFYPYRRGTRTDDFTLFPYEEYVRDISTGRRSSYVPIRPLGGNAFGLLLGLGIGGVATKVLGSKMLAPDVMVSVLGAYFVGRDLWSEIERALVYLTRNARVRYVEPVYRYRVERSTTLTQYSKLARRERYGREVALPERLDYIARSGSEGVRLELRGCDLETESDGARLLTIHVEDNMAPDLEALRFLLGVKLSFNKRHLGLVRSFELFQTLHAGELGCLDASWRWRPGCAFYRKTKSLGRLKYFAHHGVLEDLPVLRLPALPPEKAKT